jgi:hypothetical protein
VIVKLVYLLPLIVGVACASHSSLLMLTQFLLAALCHISNSPKLHIIDKSERTFFFSQPSKQTQYRYLVRDWIGR